MHSDPRFKNKPRNAQEILLPFNNQGKCNYSSYQHCNLNMKRKVAEYSKL